MKGIDGSDGKISRKSRARDVSYRTSVFTQVSSDNRPTS